MVFEGTAGKKRRSSLETIKTEVPLWVQTHPLKPVLPLFVRLSTLIVGSGPAWIFRILSMLTFILLLLPAFLQVAWYYIFASDIIRNIVYGPNPRNNMDIYLPTDGQFPRSKRPVIVFLSGGVWIIGYKGWGAFMGKIFASYGIVTVQPDYRNFPQGSINDMLEDIDRSLGWVCKNIELYGGDPNEIYLMGQSAGAHLAALSVLLKAQEEFNQETNASLTQKSGPKSRDHSHIHRNPITNVTELIPERGEWKLSSIKSVIAIAGPYDIVAIEDQFNRKGLPKDLLHAIFGGQENLAKNSPTLLLHQPEFANPAVASKVPQMVLLHGTADGSVPYSITIDFDTQLARCGMKSFVKLYEGQTHTDSIIEDLICPPHDERDDLMFDIVTYVTKKMEVHHNDDPEQVLPKRKEHLSFFAPNKEKFQSRSVQPILISRTIIKIAKMINPF